MPDAGRRMPDGGLNHPRILPYGILKRLIDGRDEALRDRLQGFGDFGDL